MTTGSMHRQRGPMNFCGSIRQIGWSQFRHLVKVYAMELCMAKFRIGETRYDGEKLVEVAIQCLDEPDGPFLCECEVAPVSEVVRRLKQGDAVEVNWRLPGGSNGSIPVE